MLSLEGMEGQLGRSIELSTLGLTGERFYSDLRPVVWKRLELTRGEYEVLKVHDAQHCVEDVSLVLPQSGSMMVSIFSTEKLLDLPK